MKKFPSNYTDYAESDDTLLGKSSDSLLPTAEPKIRPSDKRLHIPTIWVLHGFCLMSSGLLFFTGLMMTVNVYLKGPQTSTFLSMSKINGVLRISFCQ